MSKELSIKGIKKEIIDKLLDSTYIVGLFGLQEHGFKSISDIKDAYIFDYARIESYSDFISVDVSEIKTSNRLEVAGNAPLKFDVSIIFGLNCVARNNENRLDNISEVIKGIIQELYPFNKNYRDVFSLQSIPTVIRGYESPTGGYELRTIRTITFTIENW